jgi:CheY-like chemotaxis protein
MSGAPTEARTTKILIVEDDPDVLTLESRLLATLGAVQIARDGVEALAVIERGFMPDVVVTDVMMPRMDGLELAKRLKANPKTTKIPVVILTAKAAPRDVIAGINSGARHYMTKPFTADQLLGKVKKALAR